MTKTVAVEPTWYRRKVREALEIRRLKTGPEEETGINRDLGDYVTTNTWSSLFTKINRSKDIPTFKSMMPALQEGSNRANSSRTSENGSRTAENGSMTLREGSNRANGSRTSGNGSRTSENGSMTSDN